MPSVVWAVALCKLGLLSSNIHDGTRDARSICLLSTLRHKQALTQTDRQTATHSPVHFLKTICGEEEALDFGMTGFEGTAVSRGEEH